jgi:hypothetical protein
MYSTDHLHPNINILSRSLFSLLTKTNKLQIIVVLQVSNANLFDMMIKDGARWATTFQLFSSLTR